ncbi:hypothetical protein AB4184_18395 [Vibrio splendidus]
MSESLTESQSMYNELQSYLDLVMQESRDDVFLIKCEKIYAYNVSIREMNSGLHSVGQESIKGLINQAKESTESLKSTKDKIKVMVQAVNAIDKVFELMGAYIKQR